MKRFWFWIMAAFVVCCLFIGMEVLAHSQDTPKPKPAPTITDAHKAAFFKAQAELLQAQAKVQAAVTDFTKDCGDGYNPQMDAQGDPVCVAKPPDKPKK